MSKFVVRDQVEEDQVVEEPVVEDQEPQEAADQAEEEPQDEATEESRPEEGLTVTIGEPEQDEVDDEHAPNWVKDVRKQNRQLQRELREAKQKLNSMTAPAQAPAAGPKPTLEGYEYDTTKYETALAKWIEASSKEQAEVKAKEQAWQGKLGNYTTNKGKLKASTTDFDEAEAVVIATLDVIQQGIIVSGAKDPSLLVYALGKNEAKAKELAAIKDPVEFAFAVARLEAQMKVNGKRPATSPETKLSGNSSSTGTVNSVLEKLRAEAAKTGDYTKVNAYKNKLKKH